MPQRVKQVFSPICSRILYLPLALCPSSASVSVFVAVSVSRLAQMVDRDEFDPFLKRVQSSHPARTHPPTRTRAGRND